MLTASSVQTQRARWSWWSGSRSERWTSSGLVLEKVRKEEGWKADLCGLVPRRKWVTPVPAESKRVGRRSDAGSASDGFGHRE